MPEIKRIHHIAILVNDIEASLLFWHDILGIEAAKINKVPQEAAQVAFLPLGETEIELVQPTTAESGLSRFLYTHGPGMHHLCLEVDDINAWLDKLKAKGVMLINEQPKVGEDGRLYAFIHPKSTQGVLLELYQLPK
jgi:methylmalonyl-CoA/ethylmalonyl-CoA epimerase